MTGRHDPDVVTSIEDDIIFGRLPPGTRLTEDGLMARFGVTRHFVRQALVELERTGIVVRERNVGATVRCYAPEEVRQIYQVREFLQRQAVLMIPLPAPPALIRGLQALNDAYRRAHESGSLRAVHEANDAFHLELFRACGNQYLLRSIREYMALSLPMRAKSLADPEAFRVSESQHAIMITLLQEGDRWALAQLCVDHVQPSKQAYLHRAPGSECDENATGGPGCADPAGCQPQQGNLGGRPAQSARLRPPRSKCLPTLATTVPTDGAR